ncbi:beta-lactamase/transpeptidase-like protein [Infundibulicybe gibba]|nr:beta-lactamase/transpeptidase-like protein [Infundibulicybe gibba]
MVSISSTAKEQIQQDDATRNKTLPGLACGITSTEGELFVASSGTKVFDDPSSGAVDVDTVEWICSETKLIAALAGLKLIEQGKIQLDTPVAQHLPELANPVIIEGYSPDGKAITRPATAAITFQHLLNFTSGLFYSDKPDPLAPLPPAYRHSHKEENPIEFFFKIVQARDLPGVPLLFEPGTNWVYGFSSDCVGFIVERITKQTLEEYCKEHIFGPLGLKSTSFYLTPDLEARLQSLTFRKPDGALTRFTDQYELMEHDHTKVRLHLGGIGLFSTRREYLTVLRHLLQISAGTAKNPILSAQSVASLFEPSLPDTGAGSLNKLIPIPGVQWQWSTGLCVNTNDWDGKRGKNSGFWGGWANTSYFLDPSSGIAAAFGTQLAPTFDVTSALLWDKIERIVYADLEVSKHLASSL